MQATRIFNAACSRMRKDCRWLQITNFLSGPYAERARRGTVTGGMIAKGAKKDHRTKMHQKRLKMTIWLASSSEPVSADDEFDGDVTQADSSLG